MADDIAARIRELPKVDTPALRALWHELFASPPHPRIRRELMIPVLAYRLQERAYGGLKEDTNRQLRRWASELERSPAAASRIKPGTRILRQWEGDTHEVTVVRDGYSYRSKCYKSLSAIARQITGTRWSGPVFFGLKQRSSGKVDH